MSHSELQSKLKAERQRLREKFWVSPAPRPASPVVARPPEPTDDLPPVLVCKRSIAELICLAWARDLEKKAKPSLLRILDIQMLVATHFNLSLADILSSRKDIAALYPRQVAMYLCRVLTPYSMTQIGRRFGNRDHTLVKHSVGKIEKMVKSDTWVAQEIGLLMEMLLSTVEDLEVA